MNSLPIETQLDVLKFLNSYQLTSVRHTCYHFSALIKRYESDLSMREFFRRIVIREFSKIPRKTKLIEYKPYVANFPPVDDQRLTKWQYVINQQIPLYLFTDRLDSLKDYVVYLVGCGGLKKKKLTKKSLDFVLRLPKYPNNIEEMQFVRFWLLQLFNCYFDTAMLDDHILFNPQLIKLLFENEANISLKFNINRIWAISFNYLSYKRKFEFIYDHLNVKHISLSFRNMNNIEEENSLLLEFFKTSGIFDLSIWVCNDIPTIYNSIINCIETSNDCSKMVSKIEFSDPNLIMEVQGEMINRGNYHGIVSCKYTNVYNPKIKFECKCYYPLKYHKDFKTRKGKIIRIEIERI